MLDVMLLLEGFQEGSAQGAAGSALFGKLLRGKTKEEMLANPLMKTTLDYIKSKAEEFRREDISVIPFSLYKLFDTTGERTRFQEVFFYRRTRLIVYAMAAWFWGKEEDIKGAEDAIWAICDEYSWCLPAHLLRRSLSPHERQNYNLGILKKDGFENELMIDLTASETGFALAECCAMLEGVLSPVVIDRARKEVHRRVIRSFIENGSIQRWETMENNWNAVVAGSICNAAMYLVEDDSYLTGIVNHLMPTMQRFMDSFPEDGTSLEGLSYWNYGVGFYVYFADLLKLRTNGKVDLMADPKFHAIALFQQHCYFPHGATLQFSDMNNIGYDTGLAYYLAKLFDDVRIPPKELAFELAKERGRLTTTIRSFIWTDEKLYKEYEPPVLSIFKGAEWLLGRSGDVGFAAKGGHNGEPHNQNDVGSFFYCKRGKMILCDPGRGEYTRQYFGPERYSFFVNRSLGHNVPVINDQEQKTGAEFGTSECSITEDGSMTIEFAGAYAIKELKKLERSYRFNTKNGALLIKDDIVLAEPARLTERFVSFIKPELKDEGLSFSTEGVQALLKCSKNIVPVIGEVSYRDNTPKDATVYTIDYIFNSQDKNLEVEFYLE